MFQESCAQPEVTILHLGGGLISYRGTQIYCYIYSLMANQDPALCLYYCLTVPPLFNNKMVGGAQSHLKYAPESLGVHKQTFVNTSEKEFIGPGLHLRPVHADQARPPLQRTVNSVFSACGKNNRRVRPPPDRGTLKIVSRLLPA